MDKLSNEKQIYYLFSVLTDSKEFDRSVIGLIVDAFIENKNAYMPAKQVSEKIRERSIKISERDICDAIVKFNAIELFENFNAENEQNPFRLVNEVYEGYANTTDLVEQLRNYLYVYLNSKGIDSGKLDEYTEAIIDILLETIFSRNLTYLAGIIATKDARSVFDLMSTADYELKDKGYSSEIYHHYNDVLLSSSSEFDDILKNLIARFFRFLSLRYDTKAEEALENRFGGSTFYLDSSYIIRLLGFDGEFRQRRAIELLTILRQVKDVQFKIHNSSLKETQAKVNDLISKNKKVLRLPSKTAERLFEGVGNKSNNVLQIYLQLKNEGRIVGVDDFALLFSDVTKLVKKSIPNVDVDISYIDSRKNSRQQLLAALTGTDKSNYRIKHIVNLISYIDKLRGGNSFNISDVKVWLLTTDQETLYYDYHTIDESEESKLTVCVMPSELLRMIDRSHGNVMGEHMTVYKQYMLKSHVYAQPFTAIEEEALVEIANIVEQVKTVDPEKYDALYMIDNLFNRFSYEQLMKRYEEAKKEDEEIEMLLDVILETNSHVIDNRYAQLYRGIYEILQKAYTTIWYAVVYFAPAIVLISVFANIICWDNIPFKKWEDVFDQQALSSGWSMWLKMALSVLIPFAGFLTRKCKDKLVKNLVEASMRKLPISR